MEKIKSTWGTVSRWMNAHHIRGIYILIVLYVVLVAILNSSFMTMGNWLNLLRQVAVYGIISCGITFVMLTGRTDLSAGMMLTFLACISCYFVNPNVENQTLAILLPLILGAVAGLINGILVGVIRLNSFVATLGMMSIYTGAVLLFIKKNTSLFGSQDMTVYKFLGQGSVLGIPMPVIILLVVAAICGLVLRRTVFGAQNLRRRQQRGKCPFFRDQFHRHYPCGLYDLGDADRTGCCHHEFPHHVGPAKDGGRL